MYRTLYTGEYAVPAPVHIRRSILARAGSNDFREPRYRLVRTEGRKRPSYGKWCDWQAGTSTRLRNPELNRCLKRFVGVRLVPMYPGEHGWVLEQFKDASVFGSPVLWYSPESLGGTKRWMDREIGYVLTQGHFPYHGDYQGTGYIFPSEALSEQLVLNAIGRIEREQDGAPSDPARRAKQEIYLAEREEAKMESEWRKFALDHMDEALADMNVHTPEARGEVSKFILESLGIREHPWD